MSDAERAADEMIAKSLPMTNGSWRNKAVGDMTPEERIECVNDAHEALAAATANMRNAEDREDAKDAYEARGRARMRLIDLGVLRDTSRWDVV